MQQLTIAQIRLLTGTLSDTVFYTTDPGQEGIWNYDPTDNYSTDNLGTILVTQSSKRIKRLFDGSANVKWFGAKGDDNNDTLAIQAAINACKYLHFPSGIYKIDTTLNITQEIVISGEKAIGKKRSSSIIKGSFNGHFFDTGNNYSFNGLKITDLYIRGVSDNYYAIKTSFPYSAFENLCIEESWGGIKFHSFSGSQGCFDSEVKSVTVSGKTNTEGVFRGVGNGLKLEKSANNISIQNCFLVALDSGIIVDGCENILVENCNLNKIYGSASIRIGETEKCYNVNVTSNYIEGQKVALISDRCEGLNIQSNFIDDIGFIDDPLSPAHIQIKANTDSALFISNRIKSTYSNQGFIKAETDITLVSNFYLKNRGAQAFYGNHFIFTGLVNRLTERFDYTINGVASAGHFDTINDFFSGNIKIDATFLNNIATSIGTLVRGQIYNVYVMQYDDNRFMQATLFARGDSDNVNINVLISHSNLSISFSGLEMFVTQNTGLPRRLLARIVRN